MKVQSKCLARKLKRKEERKLKKLRNQSYSKRQYEMPTLESVQAEKDKIKMMRKMKREKIQTNIKKREEARRSKLEEKQAREERERQCEIENREDNKQIRMLERKLKIRTNLKTLPAQFERDGLDYVLNYLDDAKLEMSLSESKKSKNKKKSDDSEDEEISKELDSELDSEIESEVDEDTEKDFQDDDDNDFDDDDDDDDEEDDEQGEEDDEDTDGGSEDDDDNELALDHDSDEDEEEVDYSEEEGEEEEANAVKGKHSKKETSVKGILKASESKQGNKKVVHFGGDEQKSKAPEKQQGKLTEDIYGRLRDESGNVVKDPGAFVPPAKRLKLSENSEGQQEMKVKVSRIINRLHDKQMQMFSVQMEDLFRTNSRAAVSEILTTELIRDSVKNEPIKRNRAMDSTLLLAILHTKVGNEVSAVFLENLVAKYNEIFKTLDDSDGSATENQIENAMLLLAHLYQFKVIDCHLIYCILEKLIDRFFVKDIHLLIIILKEVGLGLRKDNPKAFKDAYTKISEKVSDVDKKYAHKRLLSVQLSDIVLAVKNNNPRKLQKEDEEELETRLKLLKTIVSDSANTPLHVSFDDLLNIEQKGKWWLVGSAWAGNVNTDLKTEDEQNQQTDSVTKVNGVDLVKLAHKLHMNTDVRKKILFAIISSENYLEAFHKVLKLSLSRKQEREIQHVIDVLVEKGKGNLFYTHLSQVFEKYRTKSKKRVKRVSTDDREEDTMDYE